MKGIFFSIPDSCLYLVSIKAHQCYFAYLTYLIITARNPDKKNTGKAVLSWFPRSRDYPEGLLEVCHVARVTIKNRNLNSQLRVAMRSSL